MPRTAKKVTVSKSRGTRKTKTTRTRKSPIDKINTIVSKWDTEMGECPDHVKLGTVDYLSLLASTLEREEGLYLNYVASCGNLAVLPKKPKELLNAVKYLKKQATLSSSKD